MSKVVLAANNRDSRGSAAARRLRKAGRIPGVLYGRSGKSLSIDLDALEFSNLVKTISESTIVKIEIGGKSHDAFVKDTQWNILDGKILHADFYEVESGVLLRARVTIHLDGSPAGIRDGGILEAPVHEIEVECMPEDLPERIAVDISGLGINQAIHVRDLPLPESVRVLSGMDQVVALVKFARGESAEPAEETEAPAEGAKTAES